MNSSSQQNCTAADLLTRVEEELQYNCAQSSPFMRTVAESLVKAGGKRLRPKLVLDLGCAAAMAAEVLVPLAVAVELAHNATLLQDDVIDNSPTRRGQPTAWARWGSGAGILGGNFLFMRTFTTLLDAGLSAQAASMSQCISRLVEGELLQASLRWNPCPEPADVRLVAERKTGEFFAWICRSLAELGGGDAEGAERWGILLGFGFQLADDLLDFHQLLPATKVGKPTRNDLREGYTTYPVIAEAEHNPTLKTALATAFSHRRDADFDRAYALLAESRITAGLTRKLAAVEQDLLGTTNWLPDTHIPAAALIRACLYREF